MQGKRKILIVVMDGLGDRAVEELGGKTPLQAARRPNLNWYAENGVNGLVDMIGPGIRPGSDTSHLAILGYDPRKVYTGRGPFEAAGTGVVGKKGDVAFRCNFATVDKNMIVVDRRAGRIKEPDTTDLVTAFDHLIIEDIIITVKPATEHRAVLLLQGPGLSPHITDVDPHDEASVHEARPMSPDAAKTAKVVNEFVRLSYQKLDAHPVNQRRTREGKPVANILLPRGGGVFPDIQPFPEKYGMSGSCIAGVSLIKGICRVCGLDIIEVEGATGGKDTDMKAKARAAIVELRCKDFVLMNVKAADITSHDGDANAKVEVIERIDAMVGELRIGLGEEVVVAFVADHCTPIEMKDHSGDPVPLMIYCKGIVKDPVKQYDEGSAGQGSLCRIKGMDILPILIDKAGRAEKYGA